MASPLTPFYITGYSKGLVTNKKPFLLPDQAWQVMENAYCWRDRVMKRQGLEFVGRLRRVLTAQALGNTDGAGHFTGNVRTILSLETTAQIEPGSVSITIGAQVFTDPAKDGVLVGGGGGTINYATAVIDLQTAPVLAATPIVGAFAYFPSLPVMGILRRDIAAINDEQTIWFDTVYAYIYNGTDFLEFIPGTTWNGTNSDFFWGSNYRGAVDSSRLLFVTNFVSNATNPMRYTDGVTWTDFAPIVADAPNPQSKIFSSRIIISYYSRLLLLNTWEGTTAGGPGAAVNFFNRCRFSQTGSPIDPLAYRSDIFGRGGFIDAPTNEEIVSATFIKNTLVVQFEQTTWQLRYVGEYGLPFIWERTSADFGSESTFSSVLFDNHMLSVGDKAITASNAIETTRIDLDIPDVIFDFKNANNGVKRVFGIRDYQRELVFWNYPDAQTQAAPGLSLVYPNKVLLFNYRNNTFAVLRDSITAFGVHQRTDNVTWDSLTVTWDDNDVYWDDVDSQSKFPLITSGNQQGFIHYYGYTTPDEKSLTISAIDLTVSPILITSYDHNLQNGETIYLEGTRFLSGSTPSDPGLNDKIYNVTVVSKDTFQLFEWNFTTKIYQNVSSSSTATYVGGGTIALFPKLNLVSKDINIFQQSGQQIKLSRIDFLMESTIAAGMTVNLYVNTSPAVQGNFLVGNRNASTTLPPAFYVPESNYAWFSFYATLSCQFFNINLTYDNDLMNTLVTHQQSWTLLAIQSYLKKGGRNVF